MAEPRDYAAAITALNILQSNFSILDAIRKSGKARNKDAIPEMKEWCKKLGYEPSKFNSLNAIHIAGTKGKGSTSAFISSILGQYSVTNSTSNVQRPQHLKKIGLYTSPHLRSVRERIQIDNEPLTEIQFAKYFFEVWDRLETAAAEAGLPPDTTTPTSDAPVPTKPVYFRYLTLMALHTYMREGVDTAIIECGIGGEYDSTNILEEPSLAAVTSLGIDHTNVLGDTIEDIAWHKGGVFKRTSRSGKVFTVDSQPPSAMAVLRQRAEAVGATLHVVPRHRDIESGAVKLGLAADFQKTNASLAVAVAAAHLRAMGFTDIPEPLSQSALPLEFRQGLEQVRWGGRCEIRREGNITWHLDGGHTTESIRLAAQWFGSCIAGSTSTKKQKRVLLFNQQTRDAAALAGELHKALGQALEPVGDGAVSTNTAVAGEDAEKVPLFQHALFSTNITFSPSPPSSPTLSPTGAPITKGNASQPTPTKKIGKYKPDLISMNISSSDVSKLTVQNALADVWKSIDPTTGVQVKETIEEALESIRAMVREDEEVMVLVTGSLHLVGGVLEVLEMGK